MNYSFNKEKCCENCKFYDSRTHFCRFGPPQPMIFIDSKTKEQNVSSKWPVITKPQLDYCSNFAIAMLVEQSFIASSDDFE